MVMPNVFPFFLGYLLLCLMLASFLILTSRKSPIETGSKGIWWFVFLLTVLLFSLLCGYHFSQSKYTGFEILERAIHFLFFIICVGTYFLFFGGFCQKRSPYDERHLHFVDAEAYPDGLLLAASSASSTSRWWSRSTGHRHAVPILLSQQDIENMSITLDHLLFEGMDNEERQRYLQRQMKPAPPPNYEDFAPPDYVQAMSNINRNANTNTHPTDTPDVELDSQQLLCIQKDTCDLNCPGTSETVNSSSSGDSEQSGVENNQHEPSDLASVLVTTEQVKN